MVGETTGKDQTMTQTALILGASGRIGRNAAKTFAQAGWTVRCFDRTSDDLTHAARGADVIVNGWNVPYSQWQHTVPGLTRQVIAAARSSGAAVILPGNVYVYGAPMPPVLTPETPHRAVNPLGRIRRDLEATYRAAGVRTIIVRAGDYIDDEASGNWFDKVIARSVAKGRLAYPGPLDRPHTWAWLPDLADAMVELAERRADLPRFADFGFPGFTLTAKDLATACGAALDRPVTAKQMSWLPIQLSQPVWKEARHLLEMRYLWQDPHRIDGTALDTVLPNRAQTSLTSALRQALNVEIQPDQPMARRPVPV